MSFPECSFTGAALCIDQSIYVAGVSDELAEERVDHAVIFRWQQDRWVFDTLDTSVCGLGSDLSGGRVYAVCIDGKVAEMAFPGTTESQIDPSEDGPSDLVHLKCVKRVGGSLYAAGMARRVYIQAAQGLWRPIDSGVFVPRDARTRPVGFLALDGFNSKEIYAAGIDGEIWRFDGFGWHQEPSPTNLALTSVTCHSDGWVYITGMCGVLLKGRQGRWSHLEQTETPNDFWGSASFRESIYFSNYDGVFRLANGDLNKLTISTQEELTTAYLSSSGGLLISVGHKHLAISDDGESWRHLPLTNPEPA